jgi:hypothetical protein
VLPDPNEYCPDPDQKRQDPNSDLNKFLVNFLLEFLLTDAQKYVHEQKIV